MCGIAGIWRAGGMPLEHASATAMRMASQISYRGPDDAGVWTDDVAGISMAHRRLSILDVSPAGHQPMTSADSRFVIIFNGEIYNHQQLRGELAAATGNASGGANGLAWRGGSDTETLLACISAWGVEKTLRNVVGMFAFALWDRRDRRLILARDRLGEKPLYYGYVAGLFAFASELKALKALDGFDAEIDRGALSLLLRHNYIPAPHCIYRGLAKLDPGTWLELNVDDLRQKTMPQTQRYWSALEVATCGILNPLSFGSDAEAVDSLESELTRAVAGQMISDVPLGAFLSGGVDSSTIVALMQKQSGIPVKTFSIGFEDGNYDEAAHAAAVARHLGTEHTEFYVSPKDALAVISRLPDIYDEPFSDSSQIPTFLVSKLARQHITVSLSGDGGDELFGGYSRYFLAEKLSRRIWGTPRIFREILAKVIGSLSPEAWDVLYQAASPLIPKVRRWKNPGDKLHKGAALLNARHGMELYRGLMYHCEPSEVLAAAAPERKTVLSSWPVQLSSFTEQMLLVDAISYLPDDILVKVDRAAMSVSLETRVPLLDHRIFDFAWRLPMRYKIRDGVGKWLLRQVLYRHVPQHLVDRPKMGFGIPVGDWLRGPLRDWAENLLHETRLRQEGFFNPQVIRKKWSEHQSGHRNWQYHLWDILMFQAWLERERG